MRKDKLNLTTKKLEARRSEYDLLKKSSCGLKTLQNGLHNVLRDVTLKLDVFSFYDWYTGLTHSLSLIIVIHLV